MAKFRLENDYELDYQLFLADDQSSNGRLLIIIPGWATNRKRASYTSIVENAHSKGYSVLISDLRGQGNSNGVISDCTIDLAAKDLEKLVKFTLNNNSQRFKSVIVYGSSFGGEVALRFLMLSTNNVKKLILLAPGLGKGLSKTKNNTKRDQYWANIKKFSGTDLVDYHKFIRSISIPVHIIHGSADEVVPISQSKELVTLNPKYITLEVIAGMKHRPSDQKQFQTRFSQIIKYL